MILRVSIPATVQEKYTHALAEGPLKAMWTSLKGTESTVACGLWKSGLFCANFGMQRVAWAVQINVTVLIMGYAINAGSSAGTPCLLGRW